ncbi:MAG: peptidoglycan bridge formation glycyltransferase FemA/FemB family protein [Clostridia bacterium]|nr:peptidoglycan bridge formation glycyltransferase FemA/FemB family protein [Clostridia bacterium]
MKIKNREVYNYVNGNFMQSKLWANVKNNWIPEYILVTDDDGMIKATALIFVKKIPFLNTALLYASRGPVCDFHDKDTLTQLFEKIKGLAKRYNAYALKMDPLIDTEDHIAIENLKLLGFVYHGEKTGYQNIQCRENYVLDICGRNADEIFNSFKTKCRYNIRLAMRKDVKCSFYGAEKLDDFYNMMLATAKRDGFCMRSKEYFSRILQSFGKRARLCICYFENVPLSGALCIEYGGVMSYVYGCSSDCMRNFMPNYLMQWTMIEYCAEHKLDTYDFCGIPYWDDKSHKNYGVYKFKQNFNGKVKVYAGEFDYTFRKVINAFADFVLMIKSRL